MRYSDFEADFLVAAYKETSATTQTAIRSGDLLELYPIEWQPGWVHQLMSDFGARGLIRGKGVMGSESSQPVMLTATGLKAAERLIDNGHEIQKRPTEPTAEGVAVGVPASDRLVPLNHNELAYGDIAVGLAELSESVRGSNGLAEIERDRLSRSILAAAELWGAVQLKAIQVKVGVLMAVEDVAAALIGTEKAVAAALLVDTIKSFIKVQTGIDLDYI